MRGRAGADCISDQRVISDGWERIPRGTPGVYAVLNWVNGRCYVGAAIDLRARMTGHRNAIEAGTHENRLVRRDVTRFGAACFSIFPIETVSIEDPKLRCTLGTLEYEWTLSLRAHIESSGYNCMLGRDWTKATRFRDHERKRIRWGSYTLLDGVDIYDPVDDDMLDSWTPSFVRPPWP
jgi:hypothetical protein